MANITPVVQPSAHSDQIIVVLWETVTEADTPVAFKPRTGWIGHGTTVQVVGTPGGGTIAVEGSLDPDGVAYDTLHKTDLTDLVMVNATGIFAVNEAIFWIKPVRSGGAGMDVDIYFMFGGGR